jgi:hypothetical protein
MPQYDPLRDGHPKESAIAQQRRTETTDTYAVVRARLANGLQIGDGDITQLCDEIERLRGEVEQLKSDLDTALWSRE